MRELLEDLAGATSLRCGAEATDEFEADGWRHWRRKQMRAEWRPLDGLPGELAADGGRLRAREERRSGRNRCRA